MARDEARIFTNIWRKADWCSLSLEAQWLYEAILSQPDLSRCGVTTWTPNRMAKLASNGNAKKLTQARDELAAARYLLVDDATEEVMVRTFLKHDGVLNLPNMVVGMTHDFCLIHSEPLRQGLLQQLGQGFLQGLTDRFPSAKANGLAKRFAQGFTQAFLAYASAGAPPAAHAYAPQAPGPSTSDNKSSSNLNGRSPSAVENEEEDDPRVEEALTILVDRRLALRDGPPITDPPAWRRTTLANVRANYADALRALCVTGSTPTEMADHVEPRPRSEGLAAVTGTLPDRRWVEDDETGRGRWEDA